MTIGCKVPAAYFFAVANAPFGRDTTLFVAQLGPSADYSELLVPGNTAVIVKPRFYWLAEVTATGFRT